MMHPFRRVRFSAPVICVSKVITGALKRTLQKHHVFGRASIMNV